IEIRECTAHDFTLLLNGPSRDPCPYQNGSGGAVDHRRRMTVSRAQCAPRNVSWSMVISEPPESSSGFDGGPSRRGHARGIENTARMGSNARTHDSRAEREALVGSAGA